MLKRLRRIGQGLVSVLYPSRCPICRRIVDGAENAVCPSCEDQLPKTAANGAECQTAQTRQISFASFIVAPFYYEGALRDAVLRYKFQSVRSYAPVFAAYAAEAVRRAVRDGSLTMPELVTYVPVSAARLRQRGYDQARLFAEALAERLELPFARLIEKTTDTPPQSALDEKQRRANVIGVFTPAANSAPLAIGKRILLADDILTTGATLAEAAKTVSYLLPEEVVCVTIARTKQKTEK